MSVNLPNHFVDQFSSQVELLLQEEGSILRPYVDVASHSGQKASPVNQIGAIESNTPAGRFAPMGRTDATMARRWVEPLDQEVNQLIDKFDMLRLIENPEPAYARNAALALGRWLDDIIIDAALGTSVTGVAGAGTESFDTTNFSIAADFASAAETGLTVAKMIECRRKFAKANVNLQRERPTLVIDPNQMANLLNQVEVVSRDFNSKPGFDQDGNVTSFLGFNIVQSNRLDLVNTDDRACFAFVKSGLHLGLWKDMSVRMDERPDITGVPKQLYTCMTAGATRIEQGKIIRILCDE